MNELSDLLGRIVGVLERAHVAHMIAGSFASTYYGAVRMTQDIAIIIDPTLATLLRFIKSLPQNAYKTPHGTRCCARVCRYACASTTRKTGDERTSMRAIHRRMEVVCNSRPRLPVQPFHTHDPYGLFGKFIHVVP